MIRLLEIPALLLIVGITYVHHYIYDILKRPISKWFHLWWGFVYGIPCGVAVWQMDWNWWLGGAFLIERFLFYNPALNKWRGLKTFQIVSKNSKPGIWDKIYTWLGKFYKPLLIVGAIVFVIIQFLIK